MTSEVVAVGVGVGVVGTSKTGGVGGLGSSGAKVGALDYLKSPLILRPQFFHIKF
jgi:hypothetical protein